MFFRQSDTLCQVELVPCDRGVLKSICFVVECYEQYDAGKYKQTKISAKNVILMSVKTVVNNIPVVNQEDYRLYDVFAIKVGFSGLCFVFRAFLLTS